MSLEQLIIELRTLQDDINRDNVPVTVCCDCWSSSVNIDNITYKDGKIYINIDMIKT